MFTSRELNSQLPFSVRKGFALSALLAEFSVRNKFHCEFKLQLIWFGSQLSKSTRKEALRLEKQNKETTTGVVCGILHAIFTLWITFFVYSLNHILWGHANSMLHTCKLQVIGLESRWGHWVGWSANGLRVAMVAVMGINLSDTGVLRQRMHLWGPTRGTLITSLFLLWLFEGSCLSSFFWESLLLAHRPELPSPYQLGVICTRNNNCDSLEVVFLVCFLFAGLGYHHPWKHMSDLQWFGSIATWKVEKTSERSQ